MCPINLKEARKRLSELVRAAERGESLVITRRGKEVARLVPPEQTHLQGFPDLTEFRNSIKLKGKPMSKTVIEMRDNAGRPPSVSFGLHPELVLQVLIAHGPVEVGRSHR